MSEEILIYREIEQERLAEPDAMAALVGRKLRFIVVLTLVYMVSYIGLTVLAGFAREALSAPAIGPVNLGFVLIAANYLVAWVLALIYVRVANQHFDPLAEQILARRAP